jgi:hypothetical protein
VHERGVALLDNSKVTHVQPYFLGGVAMTLPALVYGLLGAFGPCYPVNLIPAMAI